FRASAAGCQHRLRDPRQAAPRLHEGAARAEPHRPALPPRVGARSMVRARKRLMKCWIDLANSPHPLLFAPIVARLEERGHDVRLTARDNAQTAELALQRWPDAEVIG